MFFNQHIVCVQTNTVPQDTVSICEGDGTFIEGAGAGAGGNYQWSPDYNISSLTDPTPYVDPLVSTTYYVTSTDGCGYTSVDSVHVEVVLPPVVDLGSNQTICTGGNITLDAENAGSEYLWSTSETTQSITVSPASTTTYTVTVTTPEGCESTGSVQVDIGSSLNVDLGTDQSICNGETVTLSAGSGNIYNWSTGETTESIDVTPGADQTYSVTVTDANGCSGTDNIIITVNDAPLVTISANQTICEGENVTISASGGDNYLWDSSLATGSSHTVQPNTNTTYSVTVSDLSGCTSTASVDVNVNATPDADAGEDVNICSGSVTLNASPSGDYLWSNGETTASITVTPVSTTEYIVTVSNGTCSDSDSVLVTVSATLTADLGPDLDVCEGEEITLTVSGGVNYIWDNGQTGSTLSDTPSGSTSYSVTVSDGSGCTGTGDVNVTVNTNPTINAGNDDNVCGYDYNLSASSSDGGLWTQISGPSSASGWSPSSTDPNATVTVDADGVYEFVYSVTNAASCTASDTVEITFNENPQALVDQNYFSACGYQTTLNGQGTGEWSLVSGPSSNINFPSGNTDPNATVIVDQLGTYVFEWLVTNGLCSDSTEVTVTFNNGPDPGLQDSLSVCNGQSIDLEVLNGIGYVWSTGETTSQISYMPVTSEYVYVTVTDASLCVSLDSTYISVSQADFANAGNDVVTCGGQVSLQASGGEEYVWSNSETTSQITVSPSATTEYIVTVTDDLGCEDIDSVVVTISSSLVADAGWDAHICEGASTILTASGGVNYQWSNGDTDQSITVSPLSTTVYYLTVDDGGTCSGIDSVEVTVNPVPNISITDNQDICEGNAVDLTVTSTTNDTYVWSDGSTTSTITVSPLVNTNYSVIITNQFDCHSFGSVDVTVYPNPVANAGGDTSVCAAGTHIDLQATGGDTYLWSNGDSGSQINIQVNSTQTYTVTVTNQFGCTDTDDVLVAVTGSLNVSAGADQYICEGTQVSLHGSGGIYYEWSTNETTSSISVSPVVTTTYDLTVSDNDCSGTSSVTVYVDDPSHMPDINAVVQDVTCYGETDGDIDISVSNAQNPFTFQWSNSENTEDLHNLSEGSYSLTFTDANQCSVDTSFYINEPDAFTVSASASNAGYVCHNESVTISMAVSGGSQPYSYFWNSQATDQTITVNPQQSMEYIGTALDAMGCYAIPDTVLINTFPEISMNLSMHENYVCEGDKVLITVGYTGGTGGPYMLYYENEGFNPPLEIYADSTGYHTVKVTDGCNEAKDSILVLVNQLPQINVWAGNTADCAPLTVDFFDLTPDRGQRHLWNFGDSDNGFSSAKNPEYTFDEAGSYNISLQVTSDSGCVNIDTLYDYITVYPNPIAVFVPEPKETNTVSPYINFENYSEGFDYCLWSFGDGEQSDHYSPVHEYLPYPDDYEVELITYTDYGCVDTAYANITIEDTHTFYAPNAITPEGDVAENRKFRVYAHGISKSGFHLVILDRWGEKVFESFNPDHAWDGRIKGRKRATTGVYTWVCTYKYQNERDSKKHTEIGSVTVIR
ncbi:MAG: hypothetical protein C0594_06270 [Marinilabiliales bacterium]|nr:MAG: hypothetical protein C0594_06270 [Marinilabiliales bacterium]